MLIMLKLNRIAKAILKNDIPEELTTLDQLIRAVLRSQAPHLYYSYAQNQSKQVPEEQSSSKSLEDRFDKSKELLPTEKDIWIFGYGSLVWKADFPYIAKLPGFIKGYERKFYQNSIDHRGVPSFPGRVVTLIPSKEISSRVYGVAYRIAESNADEVLEHLDYREKNGYDRCNLDFNTYEATKPEKPVNVIIYVANSQNDSFAGHISDENEIAEQIYRAVGPSGFNREYVYNLENAMLKLFPDIEDHHLHKLVKILRDFEEKDKEALDKCISSIETLMTRAGHTQDIESLENEIVDLLLDLIQRNK